MQDYTILRICLQVGFGRYDSVRFGAYFGCTCGKCERERRCKYCCSCNYAYKFSEHFHQKTILSFLFDYIIPNTIENVHILYYKSVTFFLYIFAICTKRTLGFDKITAFKNYQKLYLLKNSQSISCFWMRFVYILVYVNNEGRF